MAGTIDQIIDSVRVQVYRSGALVGNSYARIYAHTGVYGTSSKPTGPALATSDPFDTSTMGLYNVSKYYHEYTFSGANRITLTHGEYYVVTIETPAAGVDGAKYMLYIRTSGGTATSVGNYAYYVNGAWTASAAYDIGVLIFAESRVINEACDSTSLFTTNQPGWVNVTVTDTEIVTNLATVEIQVNTTGDAESFTLRWTQATSVFSEVSDTSHICSLNATGSVENTTDPMTAILSFYFNMTGGAEGVCDVRVTSINDDALSDIDLYDAEFVYSAFNWVGVVYTLINSAFAQFGIVDFMSSITALITSFSAQFAASMTRIAQLIYQEFRVIGAVFNFFIYWYAAMVDIVLQFSTFYQSILNNTYALTNGIGNLWDFLNYDQWSPILPLVFLIWWIDSMQKRGLVTSGGMLQVFIGDLNTVISITSYLVGMFSLIINTIIDRVYGLFDAIV